MNRLTKAVQKDIIIESKLYQESVLIMNKHILNNDVAQPMLKKLISDTLSGAIKWEMQEIDDNVEIPENMQVPLTVAHVDYHFAAEIGKGVVCHFQHKNSLYFIWVVNENGGMALFSGGLYKMPGFSEGVIDLAHAIRKVTHDDDGILDDINAYLKG